MHQDIEATTFNCFLSFDKDEHTPIRDRKKLFMVLSPLWIPKKHRSHSFRGDLDCFRGPHHQVLLYHLLVLHRSGNSGHICLVSRSDKFYHFESYEKEDADYFIQTMHFLLAELNWGSVTTITTFSFDSIYGFLKSHCFKSFASWPAWMYLKVTLF